MKKILALLLILCMTAALAACGAEEAVETPDYYGIGLEVTKILDQMLNTPDWLKIFTYSEDLRELAESRLNTGDYDAPTAVYRLEMKPAREWVLPMLGADELAMLNSLPPELQEQLWARYGGVSQAAAMITGQKGSELIALTSALQVVLEKPELEPEEPIYLLFVFEKGTPVVVTYGRHAAIGTILPLEKTDTESAASLQAALQTYGITVSVFEKP